jgi:hypothetical protein
MAIILYLDYGNRDVRFQIQDEIGPLFLTSCYKLSTDNNATGCKSALFGDLRLQIPPCFDERRQNVFAANIPF